MKLADKVSALRVVLCPIFFVLYHAGDYFHLSDTRWTLPILWFLFIGSELTDLFDGKIARARGEVSDFGKLFDPFADTLMRLTYFLCFVTAGVFPALLFLVIIYREFGILFLRILMMRKGVAMGARMGGKLKAVLYCAAGALALLYETARVFGFEQWTLPLLIAANAVFVCAIVAALVSFFDYITLYHRTPE